MKGSYADALNSYFTGLRIYKEGNGKREISRFYNNIGTIFACMEILAMDLDITKGIQLKP